MMTTAPSPGASGFVQQAFIRRKRSVLQRVRRKLVYDKCSKLVREMLEGDLGGSISYDWFESGAVVTIEVDSGRLAR